MAPLPRKPGSKTGSLASKLGKIRLDYLNTFITVVRLESFSATGEALGKSQATVSQQINELEKVFGTPLLERNSKKFKVTAFGNQFLALCNTILDSVNNFCQESGADKGLPVELITVATSSVPGESLLPQLFMDFQQSHSNAEFDVDVSNSKQALGDLERKYVKFAAIGNSALLDPKKHESIEIGADEIIILARADHPILKKKKGKNYQDWLAEYPWVFREEGSATRAVFLQQFPLRDRIRIVLAYHNNQAILNAVENSDALTALSNSTLKNILDSSEIHRFTTLNFVGVPKMERTFQFVKLKDRPLSSLQQIFWDFIASKRNP